MANTVIQLKHSTVQGNVPVSLANGEISINTRDGKLFYADPTGTIQEFSGFAGPAGLNGEIQFNDSGALGANAGLKFTKSTGTLTASGQILGSTLKSTQSSGDEGGQLDLATAATNQSLSGGSVAIDIYQNKLRIFETGGTNRGVYIDMANGATAGVGTDLLNPTATPDTVARAQANAAFITANAAFIAANNAANTNLTQNNSITAAFAAANNALNTNLTQNNSITAAFAQANAAYTRANNSLNANTGGTVTGTITATSFVTTGTYGDIQGANAIYANTFIANTGGYFQFSDGSKQYTANAGTGGGGGGTITVATDPPASGNANGDIWIDSNTGNEFTWFSDGTSYQWVELGPIGEKGDKGDTGDVSGPFNQANAAFIVANASFIQANAAFDAANNATDTYVRAHANSAFHQANAAYAQANTNASNITVIQGVNLTQNTNITAAQNKADSSFHQANAAYAQANTNAGDISVIQGVNLTQNASISNLEAVNLTQNSNITAAQNKADSAFNQANAAYGQANTNTADIVVLQAVNVTQNTSISNIEGVNLTQNTNITNAQNTATAAFIRANNSLNANVGGTIGGDVSITGNLTVLGNTFSVSSSQIVANDTLFILGVGNYTGDILDIGFASHYNAGTNAHTGFIRDSGTKEWQLFEGYTPEIGANNQININDPSFKIATLNANLHSQYIQLNGQSLQIYVDGAYNTANAAFNSANLINGVNLTQNTSITNAQTKADNAFHQANAAYAQGNTSVADIVVLQAVNVTQNTNISNLQGVDLTQNANITTAQTKADNAFHQANAAYGQANTNAGAITTLQAVNVTQNTNITNLQNVNLTQNTSITNLEAVNITQNNSITSAFIQANAAFIAANNATDTFVRNHANAAFNQANAAFDKANTGGGGLTITIDTFTGTGSCTQFTLSVTPTSENYTIVSFDGAVQHKSTYSLANSIITFSEAPANATEIDVVSFVTLGTGTFLAYNEQFAGTGACTTFTLANTPNDENYTVVSIDGAVQHKSTYSLSGASVVFSEAPPNTSEIDVTYFKSSTLLDSSLTVYAANHANAAFIAANNATDTYVRNHANSAFHQANAAFTRANNSLSANVGGTVTGNTTIVGNLFVTNTTTSVSNTTGAVRISGGLGVTGNVYADNIYDGGVEVIIFANNAFNRANAAFTSANGIIAWNTANAAFIAANAATATDTTQNNSITAAFNQANTANNTAVAAFNQANSKNLVVVGRSTNTYIPIVTGKITIEGRSANTLITIIS